MNNHYDLIAHLNTLVQSGDNHSTLYYAIREAARKANMKGQQIADMPRLKLFIAPWAYAQIVSLFGEEALPFAA